MQKMEHLCTVTKQGNFVDADASGAARQSQRKTPNESRLEVIQGYAFWDHCYMHSVTETASPLSVKKN